MTIAIRTPVWTSKWNPILKKWMVLRPDHPAVMFSTSLEAYEAACTFAKKERGVAERYTKDGKKSEVRRYIATDLQQGRRFHRGYGSRG